MSAEWVEGLLLSRRVVRNIGSRTEPAAIDDPIDVSQLATHYVQLATRSLPVVEAVSDTPILADLRQAICEILERESPYGRRATLRSPVDLPAVFAEPGTTARQAARCKDISESGIRLETEFPLTDGAEIELSLCLGDYWVDPLGRVAWSRPASPGSPGAMGVELGGLSEIDAVRLGRVFEKALTSLMIHHLIVAGPRRMPILFGRAKQ